MNNYLSKLIINKILSLYCWKWRNICSMPFNYLFMTSKIKSIFVTIVLTRLLHVHLLLIISALDCMAWANDKIAKLTAAWASHQVKVQLMMSSVYTVSDWCKEKLGHFG